MLRGNRPPSSSWLQRLGLGGWAGGVWGRGDPRCAKVGAGGWGQGVGGRGLWVGGVDGRPSGEMAEE